MTIQAYTGAELNILPPPVTTGGLQTFLDLYHECWVAKPGVYGGNWYKARDVLHANVFRAAAYTAPTAISAFGADTVQHDPYGLWTGNPTYAYTTPASPASVQAMWWRFAFHWGCTGMTSPNYLGCQIYQNGGSVTQDNMIMCTSGTCTARTQYMGVGGAGTDTWQAFYSASVASLAGTPGAYQNSFSIAFMGLSFA
jgi:hypothetical protein